MGLLAAQPVSRNLSSIALLIPAWKPDRTLLPLLRDLRVYGFGSIILVNDGSGEASEALFREAQSLGSIHVLTHAINLGKGRALKTGINHCLANLPLCAGVVTADADGQHTPADIARVAEFLLTCDTCIALGSRIFANDVPARSRFGNTLTRILFGFITGAKLADTQTGLRAFPRSVLPELMTLEGERYEYEMNVLAYVCRTGPMPIEIPIQTIYLDGNRSSHFDPIRDSMRIYFVLARFFASSIVAAGIDFAGFSVAFALTHHVLTSVIFGRLSSLVNFALNKKFVFHNRGSVTGALGRYYLLVVAIASISSGLIWTLTNRFRWNVFVAKLTVDILLSLVSFSVQRTFVFRKQVER